MSKFIIDFNNLNKIGEKKFYVGYIGKIFMCNRCLHIIKSNQQIGWGHQYTNITLWSSTKLSRTLPTIRDCIL